MSRESNLYDWMGFRIRKMIFEKKPDFHGYIFLWNDYIKNNLNVDNYCVYQMEDLHNKDVFTSEYKKFLDGAKYVFDYSKKNLSLYPRAIHLPLKLQEIQSVNNTKNVTVLFYGVLSSRRLRIINDLNKNGVFVRFVKDVYGKNLIKLLKEYKYVLSVGKNDKITNDSFRIIPAIENGCIVFSEKCEENWFNEYLIEKCPDRIVFFEEENMIEKIKGKVLLSDQ